MANPEIPSLETVKDIDRRLRLARIGLQGAFAQAISGRDFTESERMTVAGKLAFFMWQLELRKWQMPKNQVSVEFDKRSEFVLKDVIKGNWKGFKDYISSPKLSHGIINETRGYDIEQEIRAEYEIQLNDFAGRLPDAGIGFALLLDEKRDRGILDSLRTGIDVERQISRPNKFSENVKGGQNEANGH